MKVFLTLFKHERRTLFPSLSLRKRPDILGGFLSMVVSLFVIGVFLFLVSTVADSYVILKIDKVSDPISRSLELMNILYAIIIVGLAFLSLEKMRTSLVSTSGKQIFLRLPVSQRTIFLSKLAALMIWNYTTAIFMILPINLIFYFVLNPGLMFWLNTILVFLLLPLASFLISTLLLVPYIHIINFLSTKYLLTFLTLTGMLIGAFFAYSKLLEVLKNLFETGSIKFLFNAEFIEFLQKMLSITYPANALASIALGREFGKSLLIAGAVGIIAVVAAFFVTKRLYRITLYKNSGSRIKAGRKHVLKHRPMPALMKKEFVSVFRDPKSLFSYFAIAMSMPFMVYCCYTLFDTLIFNALNLSFQLSLALIVVLVFSILTNTFCATNISRDGVCALKSKVFPLKPSKILLSKVLFCDIVSSLSVVAGAMVLYLLADLPLNDALIVAGIGLIFSVSQILIATRMDLNNARLTAGPMEVEKASNRTIAKTITVGLIFAILIGFLSLFISAFAGMATPDFLKNIEIKESYIYLIPLAVALLYFIISWLYYRIRIGHAFENLVR